MDVWEVTVCCLVNQQTRVEGAVPRSFGVASVVQSPLHDLACVGPTASRADLQAKGWAVLPVIYLWEKPHGLNERKLSFQVLQHLALLARKQAGPRMKVIPMSGDNPVASPTGTAF